MLEREYKFHIKSGRPGEDTYTRSNSSFLAEFFGRAVIPSLQPAFARRRPYPIMTPAQGRAKSLYPNEVT
jgi:hypothetical protein